MSTFSAREFSHILICALPHRLPRIPKADIISILTSETAKSNKAGKTVTMSV